MNSYPLSQRVLNMEESATIKMSQMARNLSAEGHDVISLSLGEPDFDTPEHIKDAAKQALDDGYTKYTPVPGLVELRKAISHKLKRDNNLDYDINQIVVSTGAKQSIANLAMALLNDGDEAIIFTPYWVTYDAIIKLNGGIPVYITAGIDADYKVTADQLEAAITDKTKFVIFSSPCNPTGSVYTSEELSAIADVVSKHPNIVIIADEIYEYINFTEGNKHVSIGSFESVKDQAVTVNGFAKGFSMTGWRLGYIGAPLWLAKACAKLQGQFTSGTNAFAQKAAVAALMEDMKPSYDMRDEFLRRRDIMIGLLREIPGFKVNTPPGAFYIFPDISDYFGKTDGNVTINTSSEFCEYLLLNAHVAVVTGAAFGAEGCFRIAYSASEDKLREAVRRIKEALAKLK